MGPVMRFLRRNELVDTFFKLKGNTKACVWTEPLWGVPYNLYAPYVTRFMIAMGLSMTDIGVLATISLVIEIISSALSGVLTDKLGRRKCTVIFDTLSWSVPALLWMGAQDFGWFIVAAVFNAGNRVTENSWNLLMAEEAPPDKLVHMYSITHIAGVISSFIAPVFSWAHRYPPAFASLYSIPPMCKNVKAF